MRMDAPLSATPAREREEERRGEERERRGEEREGKRRGERGKKRLVSSKIITAIYIVFEGVSYMF